MEEGDKQNTLLESLMLDGWRTDNELSLKGRLSQFKGSVLHQHRYGLFRIVMTVASTNIRRML